VFTGLVTEMGEVLSLRRRGTGAVLAVRAPGAARDAAVGDSIDVSGACLTVTSVSGEALVFDLSGETLSRTTLGGLRPGARVNIEPSLAASGKLGGHFVTGHVDAVGAIRRKARDGEMLSLTVEAPPEVAALLVEKGSVAVDGVSLTVVDVLGDAFTVAVVPHTAAVTTLGRKGAGDRVNLEADIIGKYVHRFLHERTGEADTLLKTLAREGFVGG
jgi:riboflavin synthase